MIYLRPSLSWASYILVLALATLGLFIDTTNTGSSFFVAAVDDPVEFVNLLAGTFTDGR